MTITKEQFDALKVGDELKNENFTLSIESKFANSIIVLTNEGNAYVYSLKELQNADYSIIQKIQHNCGFPFGNYSDREVIVKISNESIDDCNIKPLYTRLMSVNEKGFTAHNGNTWKFAVLVGNNVNLVK